MQVARCVGRVVAVVLCWADADGYCVVLSADGRWAALEAVAAQVARNGEEREVMLKTQCQQDSSIW